MTFSLRKLLFVVPVFVVAGIVAACGPYYQPASAPPGTSGPGSAGISQSAPPAAQCPAVPPTEAPRSCVPPPVADNPPLALAPVTYYYEPDTNARGQTYYVQRRVPPAPPPGLSGTSLSVCDGKIQVQTADGARMSCEKLTLQVGGADPAEVTVREKLIEIVSGRDVKEGSFLKASAQKVTRTAADGAQLILEGDVKLLYVRKGKKIDVSTDLLSVNLSTGQVLSEMDAPKPAVPAEQTPLPAKPIYRSGPPAPDGPLPPRTETEPTRPGVPDVRTAPIPY